MILKKSAVIITAAILIVAAVVLIRSLLVFNSDTKKLKLNGQSGYNVVITAYDTASKTASTCDMTIYVKSVGKYENDYVLYFLVQSADFGKGGKKDYNALIPVVMGENGNIVQVDYPYELEEEYDKAINTPGTVIPLKKYFEYFIYACEPVINDKIKQYEYVTYIPGGYIKSSYHNKDDHIEKTRNYGEVNGMDYRFQLSEISINLSKKFWIKNAASHEILRDDYMSSNIDNTVSVTEMPFDTSLNYFFEKPYNILAAEYKKQIYSYYDEKRNKTIKIEDHGKNIKEQFNKEFSEKFTKLNDNSNESYFAMKDLLEKNPYLIYEVPKKIKSAKDNDNDAARMVIGILEKIGTADAQSALSTIMKDKDIAEKNRIRAIVALNGVENPSDYTVDTLISQAGIRKNQEDSIIANTSLLALGSAGSKLIDKTDKYNEIRSYFDKSLGNAAQPKRQTLLSIGNTSDKYFYDKVTPYLSDNDPANRAAAVYACASIDINKFMDLTDNILEKEKDDSVRSEVYQAFASSRNPESRMTELAEKNYFQESRQAQNNIIKYLKNNINDQKSYKLLKEILDSDTLPPSEKIEIRKLLRNR